MMSVSADIATVISILPRSTASIEFQSSSGKAGNHPFQSCDLIATSNTHNSTQVTVLSTDPRLSLGESGLERMMRAAMATSGHGYEFGAKCVPMHSEYAIQLLFLLSMQDPT
jgi:hypothetical protein